MDSLKDTLIQIDTQVALLKSLPLKPEDKQRLDKKFRLEFNYNSNHLEGNTLTYGETELLIIFDQTKGDHDFREYEEMKAHDVALKMIEEEAKDEERPLTEQFIRLLNEKLLVKPFWKNAITQDGQTTRKEIIPGQYKTSPNSVRLQNGEIFEYTSPADAAIEMQKLTDWYNENITKEHPLLLSALLHYRFVRIHPFDDGNGRVARLLMNYVFLKNQLPLVVIRSSEAEKKAYLAALNRADAGETEFFINYLGEQLLRSLDLTVKAAKGEDIEEPNDLDKKIAVLSKEMLNSKSEVRRKSSEVLKSLYEGSILPIIEKLYQGVEKYLAFYENVKWEFTWDPSHTYKDLKSFRKEFNESILLRNVPFDHITISFFLTGFKMDVTTNFLFLGGLRISIEEYRYSIRFGNDLEKYFPYSNNLSEKESDSIISFIMNEIYTDTERKVEQVKRNN